MLASVRRLSIAVVGAGRLGSALAVQLQAAGYRVREIVSRSGRKPAPAVTQLARQVNARSATQDSARLDADLIWFCIPDSQIEIAARRLSHASWRGKLAFHSSGVLPSDALQRLRAQGACVASVHPLMTFVRSSVPELAGVPFAVEGDRAAVHVAMRIVRHLGGRPFQIRPEHKLAYHAFATMVCPLLISLLSASEKPAALAGMSAAEARRRMAPILRQTIAYYERFGPEKAFTGPLVRGDTETVKAHLQALARAPIANDVYRVLARAALQFLPSRNQSSLKRVLGETMPSKTRRSARRTHPASRRSIARKGRSR